MFLSKFILGIFGGFLSHQFDRVIKNWEDSGTPRAWTNLSRYIVGVLFALPIFLLLRRGEDIWSEEAERDAKDYLVAFLSVGTGVFVGYLVD